MDVVLIYLIMTMGSTPGTPMPGFIEPISVRLGDAAIECGRPGRVVGLQIDRQQNPTGLFWPDPVVADRHCRVDVAARVLQMAIGEYHFATTIVNKEQTVGGPPVNLYYIGHDPHTSETWVRVAVPTTIAAPIAIRVLPPP